MDQNDYASLLSDATDRRDEMAAEPEKNPYLDVLKKDDEEQNQKIMNSLFSVGGINPDQAAEAQKLGLELGVGSDVASRNMDELRKRAALLKAQEYRLTATSPILARQLTDPEFAAIAHDELENLTTTEKTVGVMKNVGGAVVGSLFDTSAGTAGVARMGLELYGDVGDWTAAAMGFDVSGDNPAQSAGKWLGQYQARQQQVGDYYGNPEAGTGLLGRGVISGVRSLSRQILTLPLLLAGPEAYLAANVGSMGGQEYGKARDQGLDPVRATIYAGGQAAVEYATEKIPLGKLLEDIGANSGFIKTLAGQMIREIPGEQAATVLQDLNEWAVLNPDKPFSSYIAERPSAAAETLIATMISTGGQTTLIKGAEAVFNQIDRAGADAYRARLMDNVLRKLNDAAAASKVRQRNPAAYQNYIAAQTQGTPVESMYIDASQLTEILNQSNLTNGELDAMLPGVREQLAAAILPGGNVAGDIVIPTAQYATTVAGTDLGNAMTPHVRMGEQAMSQSEAEQFEAQKAELVAEATKVMDDKRESDKAFVQSANEVRTTLFEQIKATGIYTPEQARNAATLQAATYTMLANELKMTPSEVYALMPYKQVAGQAAGETLNQGPASLDQVNAEWDAAGVSGAMSEKDGVITLSKIVVPEQGRGQGVGTQAMQALMDYADRTGQRIALSPSADFGGSKKRLIQFYKRFGFAENKGRSRDLSVSETMIREPAQPATSNQAGGVLRQSLVNKPPVSVTVADSRYKELSPAEARTAAERDFGKVLRGSYTNADTGWPIEVSKKSVSESLYGAGSKVRAEIVANLPALLERAVLVESHPDGKKRQNVSAIHRLYAPFQLDGRLNRVKLTIREFTDGAKRHYAVDFVEVSRPDVLNVFQGKAASEDATNSTRTPSGPSINIDAFLGDLKAPDDTLEQGPRGGYSPKQLTTLLNQSSDVSTVMHEFSHFYLDILTRLTSNPAATPRMKADLQALVEFGGATMDQWMGWTAEYEATGVIPEGMRKVHEAVAYSTEIYLFEGKAPSVELQSVFERFVRWMRQVYSNIREQLNAAYRQEFGEDLPVLTGEVRQVFDRMLASEDQIKQAEAVRNMAPIFGTQADSGMTDEEWAAYQAMLDEARDAAVTDLTKASLRQMQWLSNARGRILKDMQRKHEARRKEVRDEVKKEVSERPVYRAIEFLKRGKIDGEEVEYPVKLSIAEIEAMYGDSPIVGAIKKALGFGKFGMLGTENAIHPDQVAEIFGFKSGDAMVRELLAAPSLREAINAETDARMLAEGGDMNTPEAKEKAIEAALHNEARARFVAVELRFLEKATQPVRVMLKAAQQVARDVISRKVIKEIRPREFAIAEGRAAKKAIEAMKAGNSKDAAKAKQAQLLQNQLAAEAIAARREVSDALTSFRNLFKADSKLAKGRNVDLVNAARAILAAYGIGKADKPPVEYVQQIRAYNPELYAELEPLILKASASAKPYDTLTMDEFRLMRDAVDALWYQARRDNQIMVEGRKLALETVMGELNTRLGEIGIPAEVPGEREAVGKKDKLVRSFFQGKAILRRVEHWASATDGPGGTGPFTKYIWRPMRKAIDAYRTQRNIYVKRYVELLQKVDLPVGKIEAPELGYTFGNANGGIGKAELLGAIMHTGNESNLRKLLLGRGWARELEDGTLDTTRWDAFRLRMIAENKLTKADYDFVQAVWDLNEELKPQAQRAHHDLFGYYFKEVKATPITTPFGAYRGGYVPAKTDPDMVRDAQVHQKMEDMESDFRNSMPSTGMGFTKGRVEYNKPLSLDVRLIAKHIDDVIRFSHVQPVVKDVLRILRQREFADNLTRIDPTVIEGMLLPWLNRAARQVTTEAGKHKAVDKFWSAVRSRTGIGIMFANITNALQQVTGYFPALLKVKPTYLKSALVQYMGGLQKMTEEVAELSPFMADRLENQVFDLQDTMNDLLLNPSRYNKVQKWAAHHGYFLQQAFQNQVDVVTWTATFNQTLAELGADKTDAEAVREAVARADGNVRMTQSSLMPEDISAFEVGSPFYKTLIQFSGYFNMLANLNSDEYVAVFRDLGWRGNKGKLAMIYMLGFGLPMLVSDAIVRSLGGGWDDDDDDGYLDVFMSWFFGSQARGAVALIPAFGPGIASIGNAFNNKPYDDRMTTSPSISTLEAVTIGVAQTAINIVDPEKDVTGKNVRDVLTLVSLVTGIPVTVLGRPIGYQVDVSRGKIEPTSVADYARGLVTGKASPSSRP